MGFYDSRENVDQYIKMAAGHDGRELIEILRMDVREMVLRHSRNIVVSFID